MPGATNGWDAVFAVNTLQINTILFQHYLQEGATSRAKRLHFLVNTSVPNQTYVFDATLGPPEVNLEKSTLQMFILRGVLMLLDAGKIDWWLPIAADSLLQGRLNFEKVEGHDIAGNVVLDLAAAAFEPMITGVDATSALPGLLTEAIATFYKTNPTQIVLGTIVSGNLIPALKPTTFHCYTQQKPDSDEHCLVLFIQTDGKEGKIAPLTQYPLSEKNSVALHISDRVLFDGVLPQTPNLGLDISGKQDGDSWTSVASGQINADYFGDPDMIPFMGYSTDSRFNYAPVIISIDGLTLSSRNNALIGSWKTSWTQYWISSWKLPHHCTMTAAFALSSTPSVDPETCIVSFKGSSTVSIGGGDDFLSFFSTDRIGIQEYVYQQLKGLESLSLVQLDAFALSNLLFPSGHRVRLSSAALPSDLALTGSMVLPFTVYPERVTLAPAATQQFSVEGTKSVTWGIDSGGVGTISTSGLYSAPKQLDQPTVVTIHARSNDDLNKIGRALLVLQPPVAKTGIKLTPDTLCIAAGKSVGLQISTDTGEPLDATLTMNPKDQGTLTQGFSTGQWSYVAPDCVKDTTTVHITATNGDKSGVAAFTLVPNRKLSISPASAKVDPGGNVVFKVDGADDNDVEWMAWPTGTVHLDDSSATYTADAHAQAGQRIMILAYSLSEAGGGITTAQVTIGG